jgi:hypothetical protein
LWKEMSGAHRAALPLVYGVVHGAPLGQTTPALENATRSVEVLIGRLLPVETTRYVPLAVRIMDGSCTPTEP